MSVCPTVSVLRFYGCCHPCFVNTLGNAGQGIQQQEYDPNFPKKRADALAVSVNLFS